MESLSPQDGHYRLHADISEENDSRLLTLEAVYQVSRAELIRQAMALYDCALREFYAGGGSLYATTESGSEVIPLFDTHREDDPPKSELDVNVNREVAEVLRQCGLSDGESDTSVLDNVINHYCCVVHHNFAGHKIHIKKANGHILEIILL